MPTFQFDQRMRANPPTTAQFSRMVNAATQSPDGLRNWGLRSVPTIVAGINSKDVIDLSKAGGIDRGNFTTGPYAGVANRPFENTVLGSIERLILVFVLWALRSCRSDDSRDSS